MSDSALGQDLKEVYASAPSNEVILDTLELRHSSFVDDDGNPTAVRVVQGNGNETLLARLEASAPVNAGEVVEFVPMAFKFEKPEVNTAAVPEVAVQLDNATREIMKHLEAADDSQEKIEVTYRVYLSSDLEGPKIDPPMHLTLAEAKAAIMSVTGKARILDVGNKAFPSKLYTVKTNPGLAYS